MKQQLTVANYEDKKHHAYGSSSDSSFDGLRQ